MKIQKLLNVVLPLFAACFLAVAAAVTPVHAADGAGTEPAKKALPAGHFEGDGHDHSADGGHGTGHEQAGVLPTVKQGIVPAIVALLVFGVVLAVLSTMVWPKILSGLKDREDKIREEIESAEMARKQAKEALDQYNQSLAQARVEAQKEIDKARAQAQLISAELRAKAETEMTSMRQKATADIEAAKRAAIAEMYEHSANLAGAMAGKILKRSVTVQDQDRIVEESLGHLKPARN